MVDPTSVVAVRCRGWGPDRTQSWADRRGEGVIRTDGGQCVMLLLRWEGKEDIKTYLWTCC